MKAAVVKGVVLGGVIGLAAGVGGYTFIYAKGASYLTNNPASCANCHIMQDHYDAWVKSSHRAVATCNDCHTPDNTVGKYLTKADNGFWHSFAFTTGDYPDPLRIKPRNLRITESACRKCHTELTEAIEGPHVHGREMSCTRCHRDVGHPL
jgi:cytochrome c nitrite reductase small subunit